MAGVVLGIYTRINHRIIMEEEAIMPGRDKKGPEGMGPMTGRQMGDCTTVKQQQDSPEATEMKRTYGGRSGEGGGFGRGMGGGRRGRGLGVSNRQEVSTDSGEPQQDDIRKLQERVQALEKQLAVKKQSE
jgi:hypothetical protein